MNKLRSLLILLVVLAATAAPALAASAAAQSTELLLNLRRDFGYGDFSGNIQGRFSLSASGPEDLARVTFYIDGQLLAEDSEAPFRAAFSTGDFALGKHELTAVGVTQSGLELRSNAITRVFISPDAGFKEAGKIIVPLLTVVGVAMLLGIGVPLALGRGKRLELPLGTPRNYGLLGGAVCPKCSRPFALHLFKLNLGLGALDRCPYCGRWSIVRRAPLDILRIAEQAEMAQAAPGAAPNGLSPEEAFNKDLDDSRYQDL